jgi:hypothetical protein
VCAFNACLQTHASLHEALLSASVMENAATEYQRQLRRCCAVRATLVVVDEQHTVAATLQHLIAQLVTPPPHPHMLPLLF